MKNLIMLAVLLISSFAAHGDDITTEDINFTSLGIRLSGTIVFPAGDIQAAVVFVHGSGPQVLVYIIY